MKRPVSKKPSVRYIRRIHRSRLLKPRGLFMALAGAVAKKRGLPCIITPEDVRAAKP